jgi:hypothetical protein
MLSENDAFVLSRWFAGLPIDPTVTASVGVEAIVTKLDSANRDHLNMARALFNEHLDAIFKQDPNTAPFKPVLVTRPEEGAFIPPLLKEAQLSDAAIDAAKNVAPWWYRTTAWLKARSPMTPAHFLEAGAVWLLSLAIARRVCVDFHERIYPLLYMVLVAETSKYAKSTGLNALYHIVNATMPHMLIPGQTSPEGMIEMLSGQLPTNFDKLSVNDKKLVQEGRTFAGQRGILLDEYSSLLGSGKKDYMQGFIELLMRLYDARDIEQHYTRSGGLAIIRHPGICILGATTPAAMSRNVSAEMWENGAMARYLIMFRDKPAPYTTLANTSAPPAEIVKPLRTLHHDLPKINSGGVFGGDDEEGFKPLMAAVTEDARRQYMAYSRAVYYDMITDELDERLHGNYRRMHVQALKIALALASMDWAESGGLGHVTIELGHFALAQMITEKSRTGLHRMMPVISQSSDSRVHRDLINVLRHMPGGVTVRDLVRRTGRNTNEVRSALDVLADSGEVLIDIHTPSTGRPTHLYKLVV